MCVCCLHTDAVPISAKHLTTSVPQIPLVGGTHFPWSQANCSERVSKKISVQENRKVKMYYATDESKTSSVAFTAYFAQIGTGNVEVSSDVGSLTALDSEDSFSVTFVGVYGDVPLLTAVPASKATVTSSAEGDAPFRKETQAFYCTASATGDLVINWRGMGNITVAGDDDLDTFESAVSSGLTNVTVVGNDPSAVCSGELVYVTFQEVSNVF